MPSELLLKTKDEKKDRGEWAEGLCTLSARNFRFDDSIRRRHRKRLSSGAPAVATILQPEHTHQDYRAQGVRPSKLSLRDAKQTAEKLELSARPVGETKSSSVYNPRQLTAQRA